jgi:hypothetical protein
MLHCYPQAPGWVPTWWSKDQYLPIFNKFRARIAAAQSGDSSKDANGTKRKKDEMKGNENGTTDDDTSKRARTDNEHKSLASGSVHDLDTLETFNDAVKDDRIIVIDFYAQVSTSSFAQTRILGLVNPSGRCSIVVWTMQDVGSSSRQICCCKSSKLVLI